MGEDKLACPRGGQHISRTDGGIGGGGVPGCSRGGTVFCSGGRPACRSGRHLAAGSSDRASAALAMISNFPDRGAFFRRAGRPALRQAGCPPLQQAAFTLMELLVIMGIIGILTGLLLPVLSKAKLRAMQTQCLNNLKQISTANSLYLSDFHETCLEYDLTGSRLLWMGRLINYQGNVDAVRLCPAASDTNVVKGTFGTADKAWHWDSNTPAKRWYGGYCLNGWMYSNLVNNNGAIAAGDQGAVFQQVSTIVQPSQTPVFADGNWVDAWPRTNDVPPVNLYVGGHGNGFNGPLGRMLIARHGSQSASRAPTNIDPKQPLPGAINVACFDGHVELAKLENLWNYYWSRTWVPPNPRPD